jgi:hypothetical protein
MILQIQADHQQKPAPHTDPSQLDELRKRALGFMGHVSTLISHLLNSNADLEDQAALLAVQSNNGGDKAGPSSSIYLVDPTNMTAAAEERRQKQSQNLRMGDTLLKCVVDCSLLFTGDVWKVSCRISF